MVFAVRCPAARCRKYMLVEEADRGRVVPCLVCRQPVQVPGGGPTGSTPPTLELEVSDHAPPGLPVAKPLPPP
jgi:hypothetical protein